MSDFEDDIHEQLVKAYLEYFRAHQGFEERNSVQTHLTARRWLREIRRLAKLRMEEIHKAHQIKKGRWKE